MLCYRPTLKNGWGDRCLYLSDEYEPKKKYNHRSVLDKEFDFEDRFVNRRIANTVEARLKTFGIRSMTWFSGNKSYHIHCLLDTKECKNLPVLKSVFIRYFGTVYRDGETFYYDKKDIPEGLQVEKIRPDLRLAAENHLVRAEYGVHEKTGKCKTLYREDIDYFKLSKIPEQIWDKYTSQISANLKRQVTVDLKVLDEHPAFKYVVDSARFRENDDGRERALFMLIHVLKPKYKEDKPGFIRFLQDWYKYSGGSKLDDNAVKRKVDYHWNKEYKIGTTYLFNLLDELGRTDLMEMKT
jgi:hypothetical protein